MTNTLTDMSEIQQTLERKQADLVSALRARDGIAIEKSADQMDEIQAATERYMAIRIVDGESILLRQVRAALQRVRDGSFGVCIGCESVINPRRLAAVPWTAHCIQCQEAADSNRRERIESFGQTLATAD